MVDSIRWWGVEVEELRNKRQLCAIWDREELLLVGDK